MPGLDVRGWCSSTSATNYYLAHAFSHEHFVTTRSTGAIHSRGEWNEQFDCKLVSVGRNSWQHWYVQGAVGRGDLHRNATSAADPTKSSSASVRVATQSQVSISISPTTSSLQTGGQQVFVAMISGTSNTAVNWAASGGTISSTGMYRAPSAAGTYTVTATSAADPTKSSLATVMVATQPQVSISISPTTSSLQTGGQQVFVAMISGTSNTAVNWAASGGTISSTGMYRAPSAADLHCHCDQCRRPDQIKFSYCHGCHPTPDFHFDFANDQQPSDGWTASVRRYDLRDWQHGCNLVSFRRNDHQQRHLHCSQCGRNLHSHRGECCRYNEVSFSYGECVRTAGHCGTHFSSHSFHPAEVAAAVRGHRLWFKQYCRNLGRYAGNRNDCAIRTLHCSPGR